MFSSFTLRLGFLDVDFRVQDWHDLGTGLLSARDALRTTLRRDYLRAIDFMRPICNQRIVENLATYNREDDEGAFVLDWWLALGKTVGLDEVELRSQAARERNKIMGRDITGCGWIKCMRFDTQLDYDRLYRCAGCQAVVYCSAPCQKR